MVIGGKGLKTYRKFGVEEYTLEDIGTYESIMLRKKDFTLKGYKVKLIKFKRSGYKTIQYLLYVSDKKN